MTIMESAIAINTDYVDCTNTIGKIGLFAEASYKEFEINLKEIALKVLKENGTDEDYDFLATEAAKDYVERVKKSINKIIETVKKFIRSCNDNCVKLLTSEKAKTAIEKAEEACNANSKLGKQKVEYENTDKEVTALTQSLDRIRKKTAKVKAKGVATEADIEEIDTVENDFTKKSRTRVVTASVSLTTALKMINECSSKTEIDKILNDESVSELEIDLNSDNVSTPETAAYFTKVVRVMGEIKKEIASLVVAKYTSLFNGIKKAIQSVSGKEESEKVEKESALEDLKMFSFITESAESEEVEEVEETKIGMSEGLDLDAYFEDVCNEIFTKESEEIDEVKTEDAEVAEDVETEEAEEVDTKVETETSEAPEETEVEESTEEVEENMAETYMEQLEAELFGEHEEIAEESTEEEVEEVDAETYMEQLEAELFGEDENVVEESTEEEDNSVSSLLDEMEKLLDL